MLTYLRSGLATAGFLLGTSVAIAAPAERPNIIVIMADDLGFSDLGSFGGEIRTPNIDQLADNGLRFMEFYNASRCCPTRASMLTGQYQHRVGMSRNGRSINRDGVTIAEVLKEADYQTAMTGKWHLTALNPIGGGPNSPEHLAWINNQQQPEREWGDVDSYPVSRGFQRHYGTLFGIVNYFDPWTLMEGTEPVLEVPDDYYVTDAISARSAEYIHEMSATGDPFFLYVAYNAPHWPLHAKPEDIARYDGVYDQGWEALREARYKRQLEMGLFDEENAPLPPLEGNGKPWSELSPDEQRKFANLMEVHAAMVDSVDQGVGKILEALKETDEFENTLIFVLADNGASPERYLNPGYDRPSETRDGRQIAYQKLYEEPGSEETWPYLGPRWASAANTPFRYWKVESYKGGLQTPMIVSWPAGLTTEPGSLTEQRGHIIDILPTVLDVTGADYPEEYAGHKVNELDGKSLLPILRGKEREGHEQLFFEHENHKSVLSGPWKANQLTSNNIWHLYNVAEDRTETRDVSAEHPEILQSLIQDWQVWYKDVTGNRE